MKIYFLNENFKLTGHEKKIRIIPTYTYIKMFKKYKRYVLDELEFQNLTPLSLYWSAGWSVRNRGDDQNRGQKWWRQDLV